MATMNMQLCNALGDVVDHGRSILRYWAANRDCSGEPTPEMYSFQTQAQALIRMLGTEGAKWADAFEMSGDAQEDPYEAWSENEYQRNRNVQFVTRMVGTLQGIGQAMQRGLLNRIENAVLAEAEDDLLEQAKELLDKSYFIAAGVLGRAVLEGHLRKWCEREQCSPTKPKPTLDDYKSALYAKQTVSKTEMKQIEAMASVGNDAAHVKPELRQEQVEWLLQNVTAFLANHPLP